MAGVGTSKVVTKFAPKQRIYGQGEHADCLFYLLSGTARLVVCSKSGKEASVMTIHSGEFLGEESLPVLARVRTSTALALTPCTALVIEREEMLLAIREQPKLACIFMNSLLSRGARAQAAVVDQFFNSSERRLARILLLMAREGLRNSASTLIPNITHEALAEMVGTTRSRVSFFLKRFRDLGFITYSRQIRVFRSLTVVLQNNE